MCVMVMYYGVYLWKLMLDFDEDDVLDDDFDDFEV